MTLDTTIAAISTAPGTGGIATARISGPQALEITSRIWHGHPLKKAIPRHAYYGTVNDTHGLPLDQAVLTIFKSPASYTGQDTVEITVHGSQYIQKELIASLLKHGAQLAGPGEFTQRALANGKIDMAQAEAVADMIATQNRASQQIALSQLRGTFSKTLEHLRQQLTHLTALLELELDFSEEDVEFASRHQLILTATELNNRIKRMRDSFTTGQALMQGFPVALTGPTNAGKSTLLNALLNDNRAIVSDIPGTTRDTIEATLNLGPYTVNLIDTAGIRTTDDPIENIGIERSCQASHKALINILVIDSHQPTDTDLTHLATPHLVILNKSDLTPDPHTVEQAKQLAARHTAPLLTVNAHNDNDTDTLRHTLQQLLDAIASRAGEQDAIVINQRHARALDQTSRALERSIAALNDSLPGDLVAQDLREAIHHLGTITSAIPSQDILNHIFSHFCIGK